MKYVPPRGILLSVNHFQEVNQASTLRTLLTILHYITCDVIKSMPCWS